MVCIQVGITGSLSSCEIIDLQRLGGIAMVILIQVVASWQVSFKEKKTVSRLAS